jgi:hypothetical protein
MHIFLNFPNVLGQLPIKRPFSSGGNEYEIGSEIAGLAH